jgi:hypothetical protein
MGESKMVEKNQPVDKVLQTNTAVEGASTIETSHPFSYRFAWDDENKDYNFMSRTQQDGWPKTLRFPPAVLRYYPVMKEKAGDFRVDISEWKSFIMELNNDTTGQTFSYWTAKGRAQFNQTGWPRFMYVGMCGNYLDGESVDKDWFRFETLKATDLARAQGMTRATHPQFIHTFTCVGWKNGQTVRITSTGTPRGIVDYPLITNEGFAYIPVRNVVKVA